ncbi:putrescine-binding periplasmic protein [Elstera cyanobacteriorum]|nr:polyamine ABC transporter substrate-binding protein [Elstera cyanobacteriorum]GFZ88045.1 putrescine-binding periplasmic protein [Elstera cyanobacteriorum]
MRTVKTWAGTTAIGLALGVGLLGVAVAPAAFAQKKVVNVYNWSDYIDPKVLEAFTKETGVKVNYDVYDSQEVLEAKLTAGKSGYDVVGPTAQPFLARQVAAGLYQPLDKSKLKNFGNLDPDIMKAIEKADPNNAHAIPWMWGTNGIGYNVGKVKTIAADAPVYSMKMILDPEVVSKFKACGVMILDAPTDVFPSVLNYLGLPPDSKSTADLDKATDALLKVRPFIRKFHSSEYINGLANGDICVAFGYSGDIIQASTRAAEAKRGVTVNYSIPTEGAQLWVDTLAIPKDAPNPDLAHAILDHLMKPQVVAASSDLTGYANGNKASTALVSEAVRTNPGIYPPAEVRARLFTITPADKDFERARTRAWTRVKTGR